MKRSSINKVSDKMRKALVEYKALRIEYLSKHQMCERCGMYEATHIHHLMGRIGKLLNDIRFWVALCFHCHAWAHQNPKEAKEKGWLLDRLSK